MLEWQRGWPRMSIRKSREGGKCVGQSNKQESACIAWLVHKTKTHRSFALHNFDDPRPCILSAFLCVSRLGSKTNDVQIRNLFVGGGKLGRLLIKCRQSDGHFNAFIFGILPILVLCLLRSRFGVNNGQSWPRDTAVQGSPAEVETRKPTTSVLSTGWACFR